MPSLLRFRSLARVLALILMLEPGLALAYLDPNTGGLLFQVLAPVFAAVAGVWFTLRRAIGQAFRNAWDRLRSQRSR